LTAVDVTTQNCITCHNGNANITPPLLNVYSEFSKISHPLPSGLNGHDAGESILLNNNRHATCVDCHNAHAAQQTTVFTTPPAIRPAQMAVNGVITDGVTTISPAQNQYESCLRCHASSNGKAKLAIEATFGYFPARFVAASDPLNVSLEFVSTSTSSHPIMHDRSSTLPQTSLLINMLNTDGITSGRAMGVRILCTDCHNSDDNREFGGSGPNGPHGSIYPHIIERRYEMSQVSAGPGTPITNLYPGQLTNAGGTTPGPWALCGKCHNLTTLLNDNSVHAMHVSNPRLGASCSVCHTAHGMGSVSSTISGTSLVNFDVNIVAPNSLGPGGTTGISYNATQGTCVLICHSVSHNYDGTVSDSKGGVLRPNKTKIGQHAK
jgi:hypothetical protein